MVDIAKSYPGLITCESCGAKFSGPIKFSRGKIAEMLLVDGAPEQAANHSLMTFRRGFSHNYFRLGVNRQDVGLYLNEVLGEYDLPTIRLPGGVRTK